MYLVFNISYYYLASTGDKLIYIILDWGRDPWEAVGYSVLTLFFLIPAFAVLHYGLFRWDEPSSHELIVVEVSLRTISISDVFCCPPANYIPLILDYMPYLAASTPLIRGLRAVLVGTLVEEGWHLRFSALAGMHGNRHGVMVGFTSHVVSPPNPCCCGDAFAISGCSRATVLERFLMVEKKQGGDF